MRATHSIKINNIWYKAGEELPSREKPINEIRFKRSDINRMPIAELRNLAVQNNIPNALNMIGSDLKKKLIEKLGL